MSEFQGLESSQQIGTSGIYIRILKKFYSMYRGKLPKSTQNILFCVDLLSHIVCLSEWRENTQFIEKNGVNRDVQMTSRFSIFRDL